MEDIFSNNVELTQAGSGKRLANYFIDRFIVQAFLFLLAFLTKFVNPTYSLEQLDMYQWSDTVLFFLSYAFLTGFLEGIFKGKSIGKMITGTRAVNQDGTTISFGTALLRGLFRLVPFNALSALGTPCFPWHDRWSKTYVIDEKQSILPSEGGY